MSSSIVLPLLGGVLIGLSASLLLLAQGRVAGISGIVGALLGPIREDVSWRILFLGGLLTGGLVLAWLRPSGFPASVPLDLRQLSLLVGAGLLVGFGSQLGNGCTSGHGVCGISRGSVRSIVATLTFMATGALTVFFVRHVF
ncbi:YeeE/YedE family protein [Corallococcus sp. AB004]|uniref:YeeE/YedE family protein n=1 Tax=Corallococcus TaxID=83461 RepID=UPI000EA1DF16|nr:MULTISPECIES: YeeE/YedE thiosulfate transporter family protein [Corallococcus]RKI35586.1 YeeE/YedE family protein [Corallococcus sp. AB004]NPC69934.1 YeeE/YedE family protein [Corallococcus exiguus]NPD24327.1 YeeE/YedE family protein [Corallococcus exiguus]NRD44815.1 YeeE/YedE family protein [Corallococcus exiguus]RKH99624.1 YeeE/YedE family protein [Corallococcus sp. AB038B]